MRLQLPLRSAKFIGRRASSRVSSIGLDDERLFSYTSGRWLWNEQKQLLDRYRRFNVHELKKTACRALGATSCVSLQKIGEGGFNKVFRLVMQDGRKVIAKIPNPNAGPPHYTTASEVATMEFGRTVLNLPIPKVLDWSSTSQNLVNAEYILMEEARGTQLHGAWQNMDIEIKRDVVYQIIEIEKKLLSMSFSRYGSLNFQDDEIKSAHPAQLTTEVSQQVREDVESRFCIGPSVQRELWANERAQMERYHGPWSSAVEYLQSLVSCEIDWISEYASKKDGRYHPFMHISKDHRSPQAHIEMLQRLLSIVPDVVPNDPEITSSRLWHPDFHSGNIFVDKNGNIESIIDWQGAWLGPVFITANPPKVLDYNVEMLMKLPVGFKQLDEETKDKLRHQVSQSILIHAYETRTAHVNPIMYLMMRHLDSKTLKEIVAFTSGTWEHGYLPLRDCLIRIQRNWDDFHTQKPCPYQFSSEEIKEHQEEGGSYNDNADVWSSLSEVVGVDGYTSNEDYHRAVEAFKQLRETGLREFEGEEREEFDELTKWISELKVDDYQGIKCGKVDEMRNL